MNEEKAKLVNEKARQLAELLDYAKEHFPLIAPFVNDRTHLWKAKYAGVIGLVASICAITELVLV